jgi:magnesium transporter
MPGWGVELADNHQVLRLFHIEPGSDHAVEIDSTELRSVRSGGGWVWLDVVGADEAEVEDICGRFNFDMLSVEDVVAAIAYPKVDYYEDHTFVVLHGVADDSTRFRTVEYDAFVGPNYLVVFRQEELPGFEWIRENVARPGHMAWMGPDRLFALLAEAGASRFNVLVDALEERVEELDRRALVGDPGVIGEIHALRRDALMLRRVLVPQLGTIRRLARDKSPTLGDRARMRLTSVQDQYDRATDSLATSGALLGAVLETYRATVVERANEVMKVLTVFAAIVLPLSLIAGIYGMNFARMPELDWRWGYFGVLGVMATVAVSLWAYFAKRGFIGGPKIGRIPKALGLGIAGLVHLTTQPLGTVGRILRSQHRPPSD